MELLEVNSKSVAIANDRRNIATIVDASRLSMPITSQVSRQRARQLPPQLTRAGLFCGLVAPLLWAAAIVLAGELRPGFDHVSQYISELGERGSSTEIFMRFGGFVASGVLIVGYAAAFHVTVARVTDRPRLTLLVAVLVALNGIGRIGAGIFPCEPGCATPEVFSQRLHGLFGDNCLPGNRRSRVARHPPFSPQHKATTARRLLVCFRVCRPNIFGTDVGERGNACPHRSL